MEKEGKLGNSSVLSVKVHLFTGRYFHVVNVSGFMHVLPVLKTSFIIYIRSAQITCIIFLYFVVHIFYIYLT